MKIADIKTGNIYYDGKSGLREVLWIAEAPLTRLNRVQYRILESRRKQEYSYTQQAMIPVIGSESSCTLEAFAAWAQQGFSLEEGELLMLELRARNVKLSPGELAYMRAVYDETDGLAPVGLTISFDHTEGRATGGLEKKGLVIRLRAAVELTDLGAAWMRAEARSRAFTVDGPGGALQKESWTRAPQDRPRSVWRPTRLSSSMSDACNQDFQEED